MQEGTIVIADDFEPLRRFIRELLRDNGFQVVGEACDGLEAVKKATELQPDFVLLDVSMPGLNGIDAAARIRAVAPESKILFLSADTDPDIVESALSDGAAAYVHKCRMHRDLLPAVEAALNGRNSIGKGVAAQANPSPSSC